MFSSEYFVSKSSLRWTWVNVESAHSDDTAVLQVAFAVSKRNFANATDRNRIKRLLRENLRQEKVNLIQKIELKGIRVAGALIYTGRHMPNYHQVNMALKKVLERFYDQLANISIETDN